MLHVVESHQAEIEHHHAVVQIQIVAPARRNLFDQPHHVVREIADRSANQRRQARHAHRLIALGELPQTLESGFASKFLRLPPVSRLHFRPRERNTSCGFAPGECVARDIFAALDAFEQERIFRIVRQAQMRAHRRQQIRRERLVHRNQVSLRAPAC